MGRRIILGTVVLLGLLFVLSRPQPSAGQTMDKDWSEPYRLSSRDAAASEPYILSDQYGLVHVFWIESGSTDERATIFYTNFDGTVWASPVDIYAAAVGSPILHLSPTVDSNGFLHLAWNETENGPVYYTSAPAYNALSVRNWERPVRLEIPAFVFEIKVDAAGVLHVLYARPSNAGSGLYYKRSEDKGLSWIDERRIDPDAPANLLPNVVQFNLDEDGILRATWTYIDLNIAVGAAGTWLRYAHSVDGGRSWSFPVTIDESDESPEELRMAFPAMTSQDGVVTIVWAGDSGVHREYTFSTDGGQTWGETKHIFGELMGQARGDGLAIDSLGRTHFLGNIRWPTGLYHSYFDGVRWSPTSLVYLIRISSSDETSNNIAAHDIRLTIRGGNQLVAAFSDAPGEPQRGLFVMQHTLEDAPALGVEAIPTATPTPTVTPTTTPLPPTPSPTPMFLEPALQTPVAPSTAPGRTLFLGLAPILLFLGLIFAARLVVSRR
jgi:hypothetical protein